MESFQDSKTKKSIKIIVEYLSKNPESCSNIIKDLSVINNVTSIWGMWGGALAFGNLSLDLLNNVAAAELFKLFHKYNANKVDLLVAVLQNNLLEEIQNIDKDLLISFCAKLSEQHLKLAAILDIMPEFIDLFKSLDLKQINKISSALVDIVLQDKELSQSIKIIIVNLATKKELIVSFLDVLVKHLEELDISDKLEILQKIDKAEDSKSLIKQYNITNLERLKFILSEKLACSNKIYRCLAEMFIILSSTAKISVKEELGKLLSENKKDLEKLFDAILKNNPNIQLKDLNLDNLESVVALLNNLSFI